MLRVNADHMRQLFNGLLRMEKFSDKQHTFLAIAALIIVGARYC